MKVTYLYVVVTTWVNNNNNNYCSC